MSCGKKCTDDIINNTISPIEKKKVDTAKARAYAKTVGMDSNNTKMMVIASTQGMDVAAKTMISEHTDSNGKFDYAAMRSMYG
jgi:hypothetical protein